MAAWFARNSLDVQSTLDVIAATLARSPADLNGNSETMHIAQTNYHRKEL
jgi:hypothetical protein